MRNHNLSDRYFKYANTYLIMNRIWKRKKEKIMQKFLVINRKDLFFIEGKEDEMFEILRIKLGKTDEEILRIIIES